MPSNTANYQIPISLSRGVPSKVQTAPKAVPTTVDSTIQYARPWKRMIAAWIDVVLLSLLNYVFIVPLLQLLGIRADRMDGESGTALSLFILGVYGSSFLILIVTSWLYHVISETKYGATVGKRLMGLRVQRESGELQDFGAASIRHFSKYISRVLFYGGFIISLFNPKRQCLHDLLAGAVVVEHENPVQEAAKDVEDDAEQIAIDEA